MKLICCIINYFKCNIFHRGENVGKKNNNLHQLLGKQDTLLSFAKIILFAPYAMQRSKSLDQITVQNSSKMALPMLKHLTTRAMCSPISFPANSTFLVNSSNLLNKPSGLLKLHAPVISLRQRGSLRRNLQRNSNRKSIKASDSWHQNLKKSLKKLFVKK